MVKHVDKAKAFLIDGYPREEAQGHAFEKNIAPVAVSFELFIRHWIYQRVLELELEVVHTAYYSRADDLFFKKKTGINY